VTTVHTMWKGSISFGLVNIPVKMFAATEDKDIKFRYLHAKCGTPVKQVRTCPHCEEEISWTDVVKGYEHQPGQFVIMKDEEFDRIAPQKSKSIDILNFVSLEEIDPIYFNKSYYLAPEDTGSKAYALLRKAMQDTGKIAVAKLIIRSTQMLAVLRTYENVLIMESIFYPDEVRSAAQLPSVAADIEVEANEMKVATQLIESLAVPFDPAAYTDEYRSALREAIDRKIEGEEITQAVEPKREQIHDLMKALQESLNVVRTGEADTAVGVAVGQNAAGRAPGADEDGGEAADAKPKRRRRKAGEG